MIATCVVLPSITTFAFSTTEEFKPAENDDTVSLGGEDADRKELDELRSRLPSGYLDADDNVVARSATDAKKDEHRRDNNDYQNLNSTKPHRDPQMERSAHKAALVPHASLPPKPVGAPAPSFRARAHSQTNLMEASVMSSGIRGQDRDSTGKRSSEVSKPLDPEPSLPFGWEVRHPRSGDTGQVYYYNTQTHESTWERPSSHESNGKVKRPSPRSRDKDNYDSSQRETRHRNIGDQRHNKSYELQRGRGAEKRARSPSPLSYNDRHYRPKDSSEMEHNDRNHFENGSNPHRQYKDVPRRNERNISPNPRDNREKRERDMPSSQAAAAPPAGGTNGYPSDRVQRNSAAVEPVLNASAREESNSRNISDKGWANKRGQDENIPPRRPAYDTPPRYSDRENRDRRSNDATMSSSQRSTSLVLYNSFTSLWDIATDAMSHCC